MTSEVWVPDDEVLRRSRLRDFLHHCRSADLLDLDRWARRDPAGFWTEALTWLDLEWQRRPGSTVVGLDRPHQARWFPEGALNIADNCVDRWIRRGRGEQRALSWETESGLRGSWTFTELAAEVDRVGRGLLQRGIAFGDRVGILLPMVRESVVAALACAKIGAVAVGLFSGFGASAVSRRLRDCQASALICATGFPRRGSTVAVRPVVAEAAAHIPSLRTCVVVDLGGPSEPRLPGEAGWEALGDDCSALRPAHCPTDHPLMIAYTSGTTGDPKGVTLGHAGFAVKAGTDAAWCFDVGAGDVSSWITDPGWIMSPITVLGGLIAGSAVAVYGGAVDFPDHGRLWRFAGHTGVTMLGLSPTLVRTLARGGAEAVPEALPTVRVFASSGEPWTSDAFDWLFSQAGKRKIPVINYSGGTEVSGAILSNVTMLPIVPCGFAGPVPGMGAEVRDRHGSPTKGQVGELVLTRPSPGMPLGFWGDRQRYERTYWSRWPGVWVHGDFAEVARDGTWYIHGRSDDTLNIAGKRLGPAEIERVVGEHPGISESAAFGVPDPVRGERLVVLVVPTDQSTSDVVGDVAGMVRRKLGAALRPRAVHAVPDLPRTRSGKTLRRVIRSVYLGQSPGDLSSLANPESIDAIRRLG